jgi:hypothetical protein
MGLIDDSYVLCPIEEPRKSARRSRGFGIGYMNCAKEIPFDHFRGKESWRVFAVRRPLTLVRKVLDRIATSQLA